MLRLKLQYLGYLMRRADSLENSGQEEKGVTEDGMVEWHH